MEIKKGIGVSPGVVISTAVVLDAEDLLIPKRTIPPEQVASEIARLHEALNQASEDLGRLRDKIANEVGQEIGSIFDVHIGILRDKSIIKQVLNEIQSGNVTAEYAMSVVMRRYANTIAQLKDPYLSERVRDVHDIEKRVLRLLIGQQHEDLLHLTRDVVVIAHDLLPSQTAALDREHVRGFAIDVGGRTSHTAIVARAMGIPAVVGLGNITSEVSGGDMVIIDGTRGVVIVNPDREQLDEHAEAGRKFAAMETDLKSLAPLAAQTLDGHQVSLLANIEFPADIDGGLAVGAPRGSAFIAPNSSTLPPKSSRPSRCTTTRTSTPCSASAAGRW